MGLGCKPIGKMGSKFRKLDNEMQKRVSEGKKATKKKEKKDNE